MLRLERNALYRVLENPSVCVVVLIDKPVEVKDCVCSHATPSPFNSFLPQHHCESLSLTGAPLVVGSSSVTMLVGWSASTSGFSLTEGETTCSSADMMRRLRDIDGDGSKHERVCCCGE